MQGRKLSQELLKVKMRAQSAKIPQREDGECKCEHIIRLRALQFILLWRAQQCAAALPACDERIMGWKHLHFRACASARYSPRRISLTQNSCSERSPLVIPKFIAPARAEIFILSLSTRVNVNRTPIRTQTMAIGGKKNESVCASEWNFIFAFAVSGSVG